MYRIHIFNRQHYVIVYTVLCIDPSIQCHELNLCVNS